MGFTKKVRRSGGSLYITIPSDVVEDKGIEEGDIVEAEIENGRKNGTEKE